MLHMYVVRVIFWMLLGTVRVLWSMLDTKLLLAAV